MTEADILAEAERIKARAEVVEQFEAMSIERGTLVVARHYNFGDFGDYAIEITADDLAVLAERALARWDDENPQPEWAR